MTSPGFAGRGRAAAVLVVSALFAVVFGCGGGGGGSDPAPQVCVEFTGAVAMPGAMTVTAQDGPGSTCGAAQVVLSITDINDVFGAGFDVVFDSTKVRFDGTVDLANSWLGNDGVTVEQVANQVAPGRWVVGLTRIGATAPGIDFTGTRELGRLVFTRVGTTGSSSLTFENTSVSDASAPPQDIPGVTWTGGAFTIR
jgi:hypothetical protein